MTNATGLGRTEYQYTRQDCRFRERSLGKYTRCSASCCFGKSGNHAEFCAERNRYGSERCSLSVGKQRIESQSGRSGESKKPVDSQRNDYKEGTDNYPYHELKVKISII